MTSYFSLITSKFQKPDLYEKCMNTYNSIPKSCNIHNHSVKNIICAIIYYVDKSLDLNYICGMCGVSYTTVDKISNKSIDFCIYNAYLQL